MGDFLFSKIPELFYDTIGRLIPGSLILVLFAVLSQEVWREYAFIDELEKLPFLVLMFTIFIAYFFGLSLDMMGSMLEPLLRKKFENQLNISSELLPFSHHRWKCVRKAIESNDYRLLKISAELLLFRSIALGAILSTIYSIYLKSTYFGVAGIFIIVAVIACILRLSLEFTKKYLDIHHPGVWDKIYNRPKEHLKNSGCC